MKKFLCIFLTIILSMSMLCHIQVHALSQKEDFFIGCYDNIDTLIIYNENDDIINDSRLSNIKLLIQNKNYDELCEYLITEKLNISYVETTKKQAKNSIEGKTFRELKHNTGKQL